MNDDVHLRCEIEMREKHQQQKHNIMKMIFLTRNFDDDVFRFTQKYQHDQMTT